MLDPSNKPIFNHDPFIVMGFRRKPTYIGNNVDNRRKFVIVYGTYKSQTYHLYNKNTFDTCHYL